MAVGCSWSHSNWFSGNAASPAAGWIAMFLSIVVFTFVDAIGGYVLAPLAGLNDGASVFAGFKRLFDVLFLLGTVAFGGGAMVALADEMRASAPAVSRPLTVIGILVGLAAVLAAAACFVGLPFGQGVGISIGLGSVLFAAVGVQLVLKPGSADPLAAAMTSKTKNAPANRGVFACLGGSREGSENPQSFLRKPENFFWKRDTRPPRSRSCCEPPVQAGCDLGSISRFSLSPSLPQVERVWYSVPSVITTVII
jgi:hypothetical protein